MRSTNIAALLCTLLCCSFSAAEIQLPSQLDDYAVLQRDTPVPVWGSALPNQNVSVTLGEQQLTTNSDAHGKWQVTFSARPAGGPVDLMVVAGTDRVTKTQMLFGDVWLCSGQSNMEWVLRNTENASAEMAATNLAEIRQFKVARSWARTPESELLPGQWQTAQGDTSGEFTAVGYYFAKRIYQKTAVPIGLISSNWGGSRIEPWMSPQALGLPAAQTQAYIDKRVAESRERTEQLMQRLKKWPGAVVATMESGEATANWSAVKLDTRKWESLQAPKLWEQQNFVDVDGVIWYRKTFELSLEEARQPLLLSLGTIDDNDTTWVNGELVGSTQAYDVKRKYSVAATFLHPGKNTVAVRVEDTGGGGGFYGDETLLFVETGAGTRYSLAGAWQIRPDKITVGGLGDANYIPTALYNKMLYPLFHTPIKGVIWYQGESNANNVGDAYAYESLFQRLINDWREGWQNPQLPFYWVQLANYETRKQSEYGRPWAILRETQTQALKLPHTGQAVIIDVGNPRDIHPRDKKTVGTRLANIALNQTYGFHKIHYRGPVFKSLKQKNNRITILFKTSKKLATRDGGAVQGFEIVDNEGRYHAVTGSFKGNKVTLSLEPDIKISAICYAWDDNPENANLMDNTGLPAEPFYRAL